MGHDRDCRAAPEPQNLAARELDVRTSLAGNGAPIVPPTSLVDPGPHFHDGLWMSLWKHTAVSPTDLSADEVGRSLRTLHDAMARYSGDLLPRSAILGEIDWLLSALTD